MAQKENSDKCLKHMARDLDVTPHALRIALRKRYGAAAGGRWRWTLAKYPRALAVMRKEMSK